MLHILVESNFHVSLFQINNMSALCIWTSSCGQRV